MKFKYVIFLLISLITLLKMKSFSFFVEATKSNWYKEFLNPVLDKITPENNHILDFGTGTGSLPELLTKQYTHLNITGIDINQNLLKIAKHKNLVKNIEFLEIQEDDTLPFFNASYDVVTFCSVLFLLNEEQQLFYLKEALRILKNQGKIIVLSPFPNSLFNSLKTMYTLKFHWRNYTFMLWKIFTKKRAKNWQKTLIVKEFAKKHHLKYSSEIVFREQAFLEIIQL